MMAEYSNHRVRINAKQNAAGFFVLEATEEQDTVELAAANLGAAIIAARKQLASCGLKYLADPQ